jgi:hypothetical protein
MYHVELRQFPHNLCRFNLTEAQIHAIAMPWVREERIDLGERKWSPHDAKITILEGPQLESGQLTMGRGWRAAQRKGMDVTERVLAAATEAARSEAAAPIERGGAPATGALADPLALGVQLASLLGEDPATLLAAWRLTAAQHPDVPPSESLARAEREIAANARNRG